MEQLPDDMLADVLGRLPPISLAASRCVRRRWRSVVDARRLLRADLLPLRLDAFICNGQPFLMHRPAFFARPSVARRRVGRLDFPDDVRYPGVGVSGHCNGLVLMGGAVLNPATRQWATLPEDEDVHGRYRLAYDPVASPHSFQVVAIPYSMGPPSEEWPPSPCAAHVFSSEEWRWEERSFVRQGGQAAGTISPDDDTMVPIDRRASTRLSVYFRGALYVHLKTDAVMRIALSEDKYRMVDSPVAGERIGAASECYLGKSEKGVYSALLDSDDGVWNRFRAWQLDESHGRMEWVLKSDISLQALVENFPFDYDSMSEGPWIFNNERDEEEEAPAPDDQPLDDGWDFDNGVILEATGECDPREDWRETHFLGFHPFKEIAFLWVRQRVVSYHLTTSKVQELGILPIAGDLEASFPYTACWFDLGSHSKHNY